MKIFIWFGALLMIFVVASSLETERENDVENLNTYGAKVSREKRGISHHGRSKQKLAAVAKSLAARKRRNMVGEHGIRAEADSLAAAAESVAAGDNAAAAALEIEEERQTEDHGHQNNESGGDSNESDYNSNNVDQQEAEGESNMVQEETFHEKTKTSHVHKADSGPDSGGESSPEEGGNNNSGMDSGMESSKGSGGAAVNKLMSQSSELAKQIRTIFDVMSKRESYLVEEMKKLQSALSNAINLLKSDESASINGKRRRRVAEEPYRACVYIEAAEDYPHHRAKRSVGEERTGMSDNHLQFRPEALSHNEQGHGNQINDMHSHRFEANHTDNYHGNEETGVNHEGIDLSTVYWLKLPAEQYMEQVHEKLRRMISGISATGKDILIIPVSKGFSSGKAVTREFLNIFRAKRAANLLNRSKRSLRIKEL